MKKGLLYLFAAIGFLAKAQLSGTFSVPGTFTSIAAAINSLNIAGISGSVTILVSAGYTETAVNGGFSLTATGTSINPIIFQKSGNGANPLIYAYAGGGGTPSSGFQDGIWRFIGSDFITIDGIDLSDPNGSNPSTMEFGYGFFKASPVNGCQNNLIQNCSISLKRINNALGFGPAAEGSRGIEVVNAGSSTHNFSGSVTSTSGSNSNNRFYSNYIQNCNIGISLSGYVSAAPYSFSDQNNDFGGPSSVTGNTIVNFGGVPAPSNLASGIKTIAQYGLNISNNVINSNNGSGADHTGLLKGIFLNTAVDASSTVKNNTISIRGVSTCTNMTVIENQSGASGTSNTVEISGNCVTNCSFSLVPLNYNFFGINNYNANPSKLILDNNLFTNALSTNTVMNPAVSAFFIINNANIGALSVSGNTIQNTTGLNSMLVSWLIHLNSATNNYTVQNNLISNISYSGNIPGSLYALQLGANTPSASIGYIINNTIQNLSAAGVFGIIYGTTNSHTQVLSGNFISNLNGMNSNATGITFNSGAAGSVLSQNTVCSITANNIVYGIRYGAGSNSLSVSSNQAYSITSTGNSTVFGFFHEGGNNVSVYKNKIYDITGGGVSAMAAAILVNSPTLTASLYNNYAANVRTPASGATNSLSGIYVAAASQLNLYYNTVWLNATSTGSNFGSSALNTTTSASLTLKNNIFINNSVPNGNGKSVAYRRAGAGIATYSTSSDNNLFYGGSPSGNNLIFDDGTNSFQTIASYQGFVSPRDFFSITENTPFLSTVGPSTNFLHIDPAAASLVNNAGAQIAGITDDFDSDIRPGNPGYIGPGVSPDIGADEYNPAVINFISKTEAPDFFSIYPNPVTSKFTVKSTGSEISGFRIFDLSGRLLESGILSGEICTVETQLQSGIYIIAVKSDVEHYFKIVKE